jgi:hypothetical protein
MRLRFLGPVVLLLAGLAACTARVTAPEVEVKSQPVRVIVGGQGGFCPPGQAKHGNC